MKRERTVNNSIKYMIMGVVFIMTLIVLTQTTVLAAKSKSYSLVVSGAGTWNGDKDGMQITYKYTDRDVIGGKYWAKIISWKYNGVHINW